MTSMPWLGYVVPPVIAGVPVLACVPPNVRSAVLASD
jgi:hypothetical protein